MPAHVDPKAVDAFLAALPGVTEVHDLHIWAMSTTDVALTAHLIRPAVEDDDGMLLELCDALRDKFGIAHATVQIERARMGSGIGTGSRSRPHRCPAKPSEAADQLTVGDAKVAPLECVPRLEVAISVAALTIAPTVASKRVGSYRHGDSRSAWR